MSFLGVTTMSNHDTLVSAFSALSDEQLGNLKWHVDGGTPILCGENANVFEHQGVF